MLCLFLLDLGRVAARRLDDLRRSGGALLGFVVGAPLVHAALGMAAAWATGLSVGAALLLTVLFARASSIAVPGAMRMLLPQANPGIYLPMALAATFPWNIAVGVPPPGRAPPVTVP